MRILAAVALLAGSLVGCVGDFTTEHIEVEYHRCLASFQPLRGVKVADWDAMCNRTRLAAYDYRLSVRRFVPQFPTKPGGDYKAPAQVIIVQ